MLRSQCGSKASRSSRALSRHQQLSVLTLWSPHGTLTCNAGVGAEQRSSRESKKSGKEFLVKSWSGPDKIFSV